MSTRDHSALRLYQNSPWTPASLKHVPATLSEALVSSFRSNQDQIAITVFETEANVPISIQKTYRELEHDVSVVCEKLKMLGEGTILSLGQNRYAHIVKVLATLLSGRTLALVNPGETAERIERKKEALGTCQVVTDEICTKWLTHAATSSIAINRAALPPMASIAVQVFTSGTTGDGKVVCLSEQNILSNVDALIERHGLKAGDVIATPLPIFHVNALFFSLLCSITTGGRLALFEKFDPIQFADEVSKIQLVRPLILSLAPTLLSLLNKSHRLLKPDSFKNVRYAVSAASALDPEILTTFENTFKIPIIQGYGLSETVNFSCLMPVDLTPRERAEIVIHETSTCIGTALRGNDVFIVKQGPEWIECAEGETGEIVMRGHNIMIGYRGDTEQICFENDAFHSGDLGFYKVFKGQKFFFINGRIKDVIKRAGSTISLRETDATLSSWIQSLPSPMPIDAISVAIHDSNIGEELAAVLQFSTTQDLDNFFVRLGEDEFCESFIALFNRDEFPRLLALTLSPLRTLSGKPLRAEIRKSLESKPSKLRPKGVLPVKLELGINRP